MQIKINRTQEVIKNVRLKLTIKEEKLLPHWREDPEIDIFLPEVYRDEIKGDVLASFSFKGENWPAIISKDAKIILNFDPFSAIDHLVFERYHKPKQPFLNYLPFNYHCIPGKLRFEILKTLTALNKGKSGKDVFPKWYIEETVEFLRTMVFNLKNMTNNTDLQQVPLWPENKKYAFCLTHDVDTFAGFKNIEKFVQIETKYDMFSAYNIVFDNKRDDKLLADLHNRGFEIGLHGDSHDAKLAFLKEELIEQRINRCLPFIEKFSIKGFRAPFLSKTKSLFNSLEKIFVYDSTVPDTEFLPGIVAPRGCCTVFPYRIGKLLEIPLTVPQDGILLAMGYAPEKILAIWQEKLRWLKKVGGVAVINTHPEGHFSGNPGMMNIYAELLNEIKSDPECWIALPRDIAAHWEIKEKENVASYVRT